MKTTYFIILLGVLASCDSQPKETEKQPEAPANENTKADSPLSCYQYAAQGDTVTLKLIRAGETLSGTLVYKFKEKDSNKGTIQAAMKGDLLLGEYTFFSEGTQSVRQVAFKRSGNTLTEGYGEIIEEKGTTKFRNVDSLDFSSSIKLQEIPCK
jgi:hypothetical protein